MDKRILVFASGSKTGGGSGFQELVENSQTRILEADIVAVVSNNEYGGVRERSVSLGIPFTYFSGPWEADEYRKIEKFWKPDLIVLSGWLKSVAGLDPRRTINIHPAPLPRFGGRGMYGHRVHEAVMTAFRRNEVSFSAVTMHFVTEKVDRGPVFFKYPVLIRKDDSSETLAARVNKIEHGWQSWIVNLVVTGKISWDGKDSRSLKVPSWYQFHK